jgi:predicted DNA binding protein
MIMRKVAIRWNLDSLHKSNDLANFLKIVEKIEVLGHLSISTDGITQLAEIKFQKNKGLDDFKTLPNFKIIKQYEEDEDGILVSLLCTHPLVLSGIKMSNIHVQTPYGISKDSGMILRISGISESVRNFVSLLRSVMPPDKISVQSLKGNHINDCTDSLTNRQKETLTYASYRGYYEKESRITLKELSEELGMARSTLGEHIQRAELAIIRKAIEDLDIQNGKLKPNAQNTILDGI